MKLVLPGIFLPLAVTAAVQAQPDMPSERKLFKAIQRDDPKTVEASIQFRRDPNSVIEPYQGMVLGETLLHHAATYGSSKVVELLLKSGADPLRMNAAMEYPIQEAIDDDKKDIIKMLSRPEDKRPPEAIMDDLMVRLVAETYRTNRGNDGRTPTIYISLNDKDPSGAQMERLRTPGRQFAPLSKIPKDADERAGKDKGEKTARTETLFISIKRSADGAGFDWKLGVSPGPLSGRGSEGNFSQQHGYWIVKTTGHWVS